MPKKMLKAIEANARAEGRQEGSDQTRAHMEDRADMLAAVSDKAPVIGKSEL